MKDNDIDKMVFEPMKLYGRLVLFTPSRIKDEYVPKGIYKYEIRHDDECQGIMCQLSKKILVNHWGTVLTNKSIRLDENGYKAIDEEKDIRFLCLPRITISQYLNKQKIQFKNER